MGQVSKVILPFCLGVPRKLSLSWIYLKGRMSEKKREMQIFHTCIHPPDWLGLDWANPGVWNSICVSHMGGREPSAWAVFHSFPGYISRDQDWMLISRDSDVGGCCHKKLVGPLHHSSPPALCPPEVSVDHFQGQAL